jgi:4a-hydroxytetrahydrobiopterin dehydratase
MTTRIGLRDMGLLSEDDIGTELASLPGWTRAGDSITRQVTLDDFRAAMLYAGAVAYLAEQANHHPDVLIQWNKVTLTLSTHSAGGLTGADFALARQISALG